MKPTIVFFETEEFEKEFFSKNINNSSFFLKETIDEKSILSGEILNAEIISTFIYSKLNRKTLEKFKRLRFIATRSTGFDHIDLNFCKEKGIIVANVPFYGVHSVAEHTFALILALSRKIVLSVKETKKMNFSNSGLMGFEIYNKTLGVLGSGKIGKEVINIALGFGMKVIVFARSEDEDLKERGVKFLPLEKVLSLADIITLHLPLTDETKHLINTKNLHLLKNGVSIINTARGGIIETKALIEGLKNKKIKAVGLDVLEDECFLREDRELLSSEFIKKCDLKITEFNHELLDNENVIITPHNAFNTEEGVSQILETTFLNISSFLKGNFQNIVG